MADVTVKQCDRCQKWPADSVEIHMTRQLMDSDSSKIRAISVDLCERCINTVAAAIDRAIRPKGKADADVD